jgi:hypothetical protein
MTKKFLPRVEQIELVEQVLDAVEGTWHNLAKMLRAYSAKGGLVLVDPKNVASFLAENPSAKPLQLPRLDRRMLELVKMLLAELEKQVAKRKGSQQ